jgi:hypothetical protein
MATNAVVSCRCGAVLISLTESLALAVNCHCELCRSINGAAFTTYVPVKASTVQITQGRQSVSMYRVTPGAERHWCRDCGTPRRPPQTPPPEAGANSPTWQWRDERMITRCERSWQGGQRILSGANFCPGT